LNPPTGARDTVSGSVIHFCSIGLRSGNSEPKEQDQNQNQQNTPFALLAITDTDKNASDDGNNKKKESNGNAEVNIAINNARCHLASKINEGGTLNSTSFLNLKYFLKGRLTASDLLKNVSPDGLPLLSIPNNTPRRIVDDDDDDDDDDGGRSELIYAATGDATAAILGPRDRGREVLGRVRGRRR
jgi:hypothetical protein